MAAPRITHQLAVDTALNYAERAKSALDKRHPTASEINEAHVYASLSITYATLAAMYDARRGP